MPKYADLTGQRFGRLTVIRKTDERYKRCVVWECKCDCGQYKNVSTDYLRRGVYTSCGCAYSEAKQKFSQNRRDQSTALIGRKFGHLLVRRRVPGLAKHNRPLFECICDCGNVVTVSSRELLDKTQPSCGCTHSKFDRKIRYESIVGEPVPNGHHIVFLDGNKDNWNKSNLYHVSNSTRAKMYDRAWYSTDADLTLAAIKICELEEAIKTHKQHL